MLQEIHSVWGSTHEHLERALRLGQLYLDQGQARKALEWVEPQLHVAGNKDSLNPMEESLLRCAQAARRQIESD